MDMWLLVILVTLIVLWIIYWNIKPHNFPPGPPCLPIWGSYWLVLLCDYKYLHKAFCTLQEWYKTKVMSVYLGAFPCVVVGDYESVKEALTNPDLQGRVDSELARIRAFGKMLGLILNEGDDWNEQRRFLLRNMRDVGYARRYQKQEDVYAQEVQDLMDLLNGHRTDNNGVFKDGCALFPTILYPTVVNSLWSMLTGSALPPEEHSKLYKLGDSALKFTRSIDATGSAITFFPWLKYVSAKYFGYNAFLEANSAVYQYIKGVLKNLLVDYSDDNERGFIDTYWKHIKEHKSNSQETSFSEEQLYILLQDMTVPIYNALIPQIAYGILCSVHYPEVINKVHEELDSVVGRGRLPTLDDRPSLHYTEAFNRETMRRYSGSPLGVIRQATENTSLLGYSIPKGTVVITNTYSHHMDKDVWGDPEVFRPERFLDEDGKLMRKDITFPFGGGRRVCVSETFSKYLIFFVLARLFQNFTFSIPEGKSIPHIDERIPGITSTLPEFWLKVTPRK